MSSKKPREEVPENRKASPMEYVVTSRPREGGPVIDLTPRPPNTAVADEPPSGRDTETKGA